MCYPIVSASSNASRRFVTTENAEPFVAKQALAMVLLLVPPAVSLKQRRCGDLPCERTNESDAARTVLWPGATPFWVPFGVPKPLRAVGGRSRPRASCMLAEPACLPRH